MHSYNKNKPDSIQSMFDNIADSYDRTNAVLSFYLHHTWNAALVRNVVVPCEPKSLVDLCAGTGEIAFRSIKAVSSLETVQLVDFSAQMLGCAKHKARSMELEKPSISYLQADVQELPLPDNSVDCMTMAYGIRNVANPFQCFREVYRTLEPGGSFGILELTRPSNPFLRAMHFAYLKTVLPLLGKWLTSDKDAYTYLCNSIHTFVKPDELKKTLEETGFRHLRVKPLAGGIATLFIAQKLS